MLWYCRFRWHPNTTAEQVRSRLVEQDSQRADLENKIRMWCNLAGGGAGFMLIDTDDPRELTDILQPYMDLVSWDVHAVYELPYKSTVEGFRSSVAESRSADAGADKTVR
jgi:hypothetical protein